MKRLAPAIVALAALGLYSWTLAPGLLWGDSAKFQRMAWERELRFDEAGHPAWVLLMSPVARIPGVEPARATNMASAVLSALALAFAFRIMRRLGASMTASVVASLALAVSHTFWMHAVVTEVYAFNSVVSLAVLGLILSVLDRPEGAPVSEGMLLVTGLALGMAVGNHAILLMWLPGLAWLMMLGVARGSITRPDALGAGAGIVVGLLPFAVGSLMRQGGESFHQVVLRLGGQMIDVSGLARNSAQFAGYLLYQFPVPLMLLAAVVGMAALWRRRAGIAFGLGMIYLVNAAFAFAYPFRDRYAFYLPSYLIVAVLAAVGLDVLIGRTRSRMLSWAVAAVICVAAPPVVYKIAAREAEGLFGRWLPPMRELPGRDPVRFHLDPDKSGHREARRYAEAALGLLPENGVLLADHTVREPMTYLQAVEGLKDGVEITYRIIPEQVEFLKERANEGHAVFIAGTDSYYDVQGLSKSFRLEPEGLLFRLRPLPKALVPAENR